MDTTAIRKSLANAVATGTPKQRARAIRALAVLEGESPSPRRRAAKSATARAVDAAVAADLAMLRARLGREPTALEILEQAHMHAAGSGRSIGARPSGRTGATYESPRAEELDRKMKIPNASEPIRREGNELVLGVMTKQQARAYRERHAARLAGGEL